MEHLGSILAVHFPAARIAANVLTDYSLQQVQVYSYIQIKGRLTSETNCKYWHSSPLSVDISQNIYISWQKMGAFSRKRIRMWFCQIKDLLCAHTFRSNHLIRSNGAQTVDLSQDLVKTGIICVPVWVFLSSYLVRQYMIRILHCKVKILLFYHNPDCGQREVVEAHGRHFIRSYVSY